MRKKPNSKMIGLFILSGIALFIATIGMFVADRIFKDADNMVVMYFSESLKGLSVGSPVVFKGVEIGKVSKIDIITDLENFEFSLPVYVTFANKKIITTHSKEERMKVLPELIDKGLRGRLTIQNYLTGQLMVELEMMPEDTPKAFHPEVKMFGHVIPEIPTALSPFAEISQGLQDIPIKETFQKINLFMDSLNENLVPKVSKVVDGVSSISQTTDKVPDTIQNVNKVMSSIAAAAKSLSNLADYLERHPESILKGKGSGGYGYE